MSAPRHATPIEPLAHIVKRGSGGGALQMKTYLTRPSKGGKRGEGKGGEDCAALTFFSRTTTKGSLLPKSTSPWEITPQGKQQKGRRKRRGIRAYPLFSSSVALLFPADANCSPSLPLLNFREGKTVAAVVRSFPLHPPLLYQLPYVHVYTPFSLQGARMKTSTKMNDSAEISLPREHGSRGEVSPASSSFF